MTVLTDKPLNPRTPSKRGAGAPKLISSPSTSRARSKSATSRKLTKKDSVIDLNILRAQTSREIAELIALLKAVKDMVVIEVDSRSVSESDFRFLVAKKCPIIFRDYASDWRCVGHWSTDGYLKRAAAEEAKTCPHRKYRQFTAQSAENGRLHLTDGKAKAKSVSISEFLEHTETKDEFDGLYMLGIHSVANHSLAYCPVQRHADDEEIVAPLTRDVPSEIDFLNWYAQILAEEQKNENPIKYDHQQFFLAKGYAFTDLHYDSYDNFYVAVSGTRRWTLACPNASRWLIDSAAGKLKSGSACIPHQDSFPPGSPAQIYPFAYVDLQPGDMLYVPACWWHLVESKPGDDGFSSAFNFFFSKPYEEVFGEFQKRLAETDAIVNDMQSECRERIADAFRTKSDESEVAEKITLAPKGLRQALWDQLLKLNKVHGIGEELEMLHAKFESNSIEKVVLKSTKARNRSKSAPRTSRYHVKN